MTQEDKTIYLGKKLKKALKKLTLTQQENLISFITEVVEETRKEQHNDTVEKCAKICDILCEFGKPMGTASDCAQAIRGRGI